MVSELSRRREGEPSRIFVGAVRTVMRGGSRVAQRVVAGKATARPDAFPHCCSHSEVAEQGYPDSIEVHCAPELLSRKHRWIWELRTQPKIREEERIDAALALGAESDSVSEEPRG